MDPQGGFALVALGRVVPPTTPPLAQLRPVMARDILLDRSRRAARAAASDIVAKANKGGSFASLYAATGFKVPLRTCDPSSLQPLSRKATPAGLA